MLFSLAAKLRRGLGKRYYALRHRGHRSKEYSIPLPDGYGPQRVHVTIDVPKMPRHANFRFSEHVVDTVGNPTQTVLATARGGFAISHDLGDSWRFVNIPGWEDHAFIHVYPLGASEYLAQVKPAHLERNRAVPVDVLIVDDRGRVLDQKKAQGVRWHGCRAVHLANGTLMYAEYPRNKDDCHASARVFRSRDRGRNWETVFEQTPDEIRHFHFLQPRRGSSGEWWLTSGDAEHQSKIWVTKDDGDTWRDITANTPLTIDGTTYSRSIFRLTDLVWTGGEVIWGTDDPLLGLGAEAGARVFRSPIGPTLAPRFAGRTRWAIRSMVEVGDFIVVLTQASNLPTTPREQSRPGVFLMPKHPPDPAKFIHLFDVENFAPRPLAGKGFTYSRASRVALDGTFFSYRAPYQALPLPQQILRWKISFA